MVKQIIEFSYLGYKIINGIEENDAFIQDQIIEKIALYIIDKHVNYGNYSCVDDNQREYLLQEISGYREFLYGFSDRKFDINNSKLSPFLQEIKAKLGIRNTNSNITEDVLIDDSEIMDNMYEVLDEWILPPILDSIESDEIEIHFVDVFGEKCEKALRELLSQYGIKVIEKSVSEVKRSAFSVYYGDDNVLEFDGLNESEGKVTLWQDISESIVLDVEYSNKKRKRVDFFLPFWAKGDVIEIHVSIQNGMSLLKCRLDDSEISCSRYI